MNRKLQNVMQCKIRSSVQLLIPCGAQPFEFRNAARLNLLRARATRQQVETAAYLAPFQKGKGERSYMKAYALNVIPYALLLIVLFINVFMQTVNAAEDLRDLQSDGGWMAIVGDVADDTEAGPFLGDEIGRTICTDGTDLYRASGPLIAISNKIYKLEFKEHKWKKSLYGGKCKGEYIVQELLARNIETNETSTLISAAPFLKEAKECVSSGLRELLHPDQAILNGTVENCYGRNAEYVHKINILSVYNDHISIHATTYANSPFAAHGNFSGSWQTYKIDSVKLVPSCKWLLTSQVERQAWKQLAKSDAKFVLTEDDNGETTVRPECRAGFALVPGAGFCNLEYAVTACAGAHYDVDDSTVVKLVAGCRSPAELKSAKFVQAHPHLLQWKSLPFYSVSPDQAAVIYQLKNNLYWQNVNGGKAILVSPIHKVRGIQWVQKKIVTKEVVSKLLTKQTPAAPAKKAIVREPEAQKVRQ